MIISELEIEGLFWIKADPYIDNRGKFSRIFCQNVLLEHDIEFDIKQTNISQNESKYTMRGFHYQKPPFLESKIITCVTGSVHNVVIDLRKESKTFLKKFEIVISSKVSGSLLVPAGCANAFLTLEENTVVYYLMSSFFSSESYSGFKYDDSFFDVKWPTIPLVISDKDNNFKKFDLSEIS